MNNERKEITSQQLEQLRKMENKLYAIAFQDGLHDKGAYDRLQRSWCLLFEAIEMLEDLDRCNC